MDSYKQILIKQKFYNKLADNHSKRTKIEKRKVNSYSRHCVKCYIRPASDRTSSSRKRVAHMLEEVKQVQTKGNDVDGYYKGFVLNLLFSHSEKIYMFLEGYKKCINISLKFFFLCLNNTNIGLQQRLRYK